MSAGSGVLPPPRGYAATGTRDEGWPAGTECQWQAPDVEGPGGLWRCTSLTITTYPQSGQKDEGLAADLNPLL